MSANELQPNSESLTRTAFREGQTLAGCLLLGSRVQTGSESEVWLATDEVLGKSISLHFLPDAVRRDAAAMAELRTVVKRNRQLIHPNIVRVHDLVEDVDWAAISMDAIPVESLQVQQSRLGAKQDRLQAQTWISQLAQTLDDAHKINLTHGDLNPANLFLSEGGKLMVASFGFHRPIAEAQKRAGVVTKSGMAYLSPQQQAGEIPVPADDLYAVGIIAHELFTGEKPEADANGSGAPVAVGQRIGEPSGFPAEWDRLIGSCLEKIPALRPKAAGEIAAAFAPAHEAAAPVESEAGSPAQGPVVEAEKVTPRAVAMSDAAPAPVEAPPVSEVPVEPAPEAAQQKAEGAPATSANAEPGGDAKPESKPFETKILKRPTPLPTNVGDGKKSSLLNDDENSFPKLRSKPSRMPALAATITIAALVGSGIYISNSRKKNAPGTQPGIAIAESQEGTEIRSVNNPIDQPLPSPDPVPVSAAEPPVAEVVKTAPAPAVSDPVAQPPIDKPVTVAAAPPLDDSREVLLLAANKPRAPKSTPTPAPSLASETAPAPAAAAAALITPEQAQAIDKDPAVAEKISALEKAKQAAEAAETAHKSLLSQQQDAEMAIADLKKTLDQKAKEAAPLKKETEDLIKQKKLKEDAQKAAERDVEQARQVAAEKARVLEEAKKVVADLESQNSQKLAAQAKADFELQGLQKALEERQRIAADVAKAASEASLTRQQQTSAVRRAEQDAEQIRRALQQSLIAENARRSREEAERVKAEKSKEREKIEREIVEMKKMFEDKLKTLEAAQKAMSDADAKSKDSEALHKQAEEEAKKLFPAKPSGSAAPVEKAPAPAPIPEVSVTPKPAPERPKAAALETPLMEVDKNLPPPPTVTPAPVLAMKTEPKVAPATPAATAANAPKAPGTIENSLGMRFVPVGDLYFSVWQTRVKDFDVFAKAVNLRSTAWKGPGFKQAADHPVVNVTWQEAMAFCKWLTDLEKKDGSLAAGQYYRLPTDVEWSQAVGLPDESGKTPEARDMGVPDVYPWGTQWPPPRGAGNYTGEETGSDVAIKGYDDGFPWTSPVGTFPANKFGLYDMGGNVWQWVMDSWNTESKHKVLRGASWYNGALKLSLLSSCRVHAAADSSTDNYGFRIVRASDAAKSARK